MTTSIVSLADAQADAIRMRRIARLASVITASAKQPGVETIDLVAALNELEELTREEAEAYEARLLDFGGDK